MFTKSKLTFVKKKSKLTRKFFLKKIDWEVRTEMLEYDIVQ